MIRKLITNKYLIGYAAIYLTTLGIMIAKKRIAFEEVFMLLLIIGVIFSSIAWVVSRSASPVFEDNPAQQNEPYMLIGIIAWFVLYITYYREIPVTYFPEGSPGSALQTGLEKLLFIIVIPLIIYRTAYNFRLKDWGFVVKAQDFFNRRTLIIFFTFFVIILLFQYAAGSGARPVREGLLSGRQLLIGLPFYFIWLLLTVGLVEEFFFRSLLQSRISVLLRSQIGGIVVSSLIFGLAHAPGIYLRGGGTLANLGPDPGFLLSVGYSILILSVAGWFLAIIWARTKNLWLVAGIHALVDLLPGVSAFIETWGIK